MNFTSISTLGAASCEVKPNNFDSQVPFLMGREINGLQF